METENNQLLVLLSGSSTMLEAICNDKQKQLPLLTIFTEFLGLFNLIFWVLLFSLLLSDIWASCTHDVWDIFTTFKLSAMVFWMF